MVSLSDRASDALQPAKSLSPAERVQAFADQHKLTLKTVFVPFSLSRNAKPRDGSKEPWKSLNWSVTLQRDGRDVLTTDYSQGIGHAPARKRTQAQMRISANAIGRTIPRARDMMADYEIEHGRIAKGYNFGRGISGGDLIKPPAITDILYSLSMDASVLDEGSFENWAESLGYSPDSRSAEATYRACLEVALLLRGAIGDVGMNALREACEDY